VLFETEAKKSFRTILGPPKRERKPPTNALCMWQTGRPDWANLGLLGDSLILAVSLKITEVAQFYLYLFHGNFFKIKYSFRQKRWLGYILGELPPIGR
jgi:hypothetical protein